MLKTLSDFLNLDKNATQEFIYSILIALAAIAVGIIIQAIIVYLFKKWHHRKGFSIRGIHIEMDHLNGPLRLFIPVIILAIVTPFLKFPEDARDVIDHVTVLFVIGGFGWVAVRIVNLIRDLALGQYNLDQKDNLKARSLYTQVRVIRRVVVMVIIFFTICIMLMTFPAVRKLGVSILASAGVIGIIIGFAAQKTLGNLLAGIQIALAQPIRLDDVVIVENEWGRIEEITLTYVVVRIWDLRRLVVPISYFVEQPFQNWTRISADLLGTVYIYADYRVPVEHIRQELKRILGQSPLWDKKVWNLQVTDATDKTVELRALMSAPDSSSAWDLRCSVREKLIDYMQREFPQYLPRVRLDMEDSTDKANPNH